MSLNDQVQAFLLDHSVDIAVLPEADINAASGLSFCNDWRARGMHAALSPPEAGVSRIALISSAPFKQVTLSTGEAATRHVAVLTDLEGPSGATVTIMIVGVYLQAGDESAAAGQAEDLAQLALHSGFRFLLLGDFNLEQEHPVIMECATTGVIKRCDDCYPGLLPPTGPAYRGTRRRRIDFGLTHCQWPALSTETLEGPSDHLVVTYTFEATAPLLRRGPRRRPVRQDIPAETLESQSEAWDDAAFFSACRAGDLDEAWRLLSGWGEDLLCDPDGLAIPRSSVWNAAEPAARCMGKRLERSAGLRALLKLLSRLRMAVAQPHDWALWRRICKSLANVRRLVPELPPIHQADAAVVERVAALAQAYSKQEREAARTLWKRTTRTSLDAARTYIKGKADQVLEWNKTAVQDRAPTSGRHPAIEVDRQARIWERKWATQCTASDPCPEFDRILGCVPRPASTDVEFEITPGMLRASLRSMQRKSSGPDGWDASALLQLPPRWWQGAAHLWSCVVEQSRVPEAWVRGRTALLWKPNGDTRPISILPFIWRCGAKLLNQQLSVWTASWRCHFDSGGIAGTSSDTALQQLSRELRMGAQLAVQQDVSSFFDSLEYRLTARMLRHLRAPERLVALFENYCTRSSRLFSLQGALGREWVKPERGLPQGCPLSPVIAAAVSHCWAAYLLASENPCTAPVTGHAYVDDRCLLLRAGAPVRHLRDALARSDAFDLACKLTLSLKKCAVVASTDNVEAASLARDLRYQRTQVLEVLGVEVPFDGTWGLLRFSLTKVELRLRLLRGLDLRLCDARQLIRSLVVPCYTWAAPYAAPNAQDLEAIRQEILSLCSRQVGQEAARVLFYEVAGWFLEPQFALDAAVLRATWRLVVRPPAWRETLPVAEAALSPQLVLPQLAGVLDRLKWSLSHNARHLCCTDPSGEARRVCIGLESFSTVLQWLTVAYRMRYVLKAGRVWHHRDRGPDVARGLQCPVPSREAHDEFGGHKLVFQEARGDRNLSLAAFGAGCTNWFFNAKGDFSQGHPRHKCWCGGSHPSRPHLVWNCNHTSSIRRGIPLPTDRAAERLFAKPVPLRPRPPPAIDLEGFETELCEQLEPLLSHAVAIVATDGSSKQEVGAMGFALGSSAATLAVGDDLEDQTSFRMELQAVHLLLCALSDAVGSARVKHTLHCKQVWIAVDCESVILAIQGCKGFDYFLLLERVRQARRDLQALGLRIAFVWVPSHGKRPNWKPPHGLNGTLLRALNHSADEAAGQCMERRRRNSARAQWATLRQQAVEWEVQALRAVAQTASAYHGYLKTLGHGPRDDFPVRVEP